MQIVKIENEGMPFKEDPDRRGDMFVTVNVQFPQSLTGDQVNIVGELFGPVPEAEIIRTSEL
jgi:DnaJ-class molecular chaperone